MLTAALSLLALGSPTQSPEYDAHRCYQHWPTKHQHCQVAVAICIAESGGNCNAKNRAGNSPPSEDRGLWQINDYWHKEVSDKCAFDCDCNGKEAHRISSGGADWSQWATYTHGVFKQYLSVAKEECDQVIIDSQLVEDVAPAESSGNFTRAGGSDIEVSHSSSVNISAAPDDVEEVMSFDPSAAVEWSKQHCDGSGKECPCGNGVGTGCEPFVLGKSCQCAEFAAHALCHGGMFRDCAGSNTDGCPDTSHSMWSSCKGYNLRYGGDLHANLKKRKGWKEVSASNAKKGSVVFYTVNGVAYAHQCLYIGNGLVNCHNNNRCGVGMHLYPFTSILSPP